MSKALFTIVFMVIAMHTSAQIAYQEEIRKWDSIRHAFLKSENGWLNLIGLLWLSPGKNCFGSDPSNAILFPAGSIAPKAGIFELSDGLVTMTTTAADITVDGRRSTISIIFHKDSVTLPVSATGSLRWTIKKSEDRYGIRLRDLKSPAIEAFRGIERFPADTAWRVVARLEKSGSSLAITNVLGQTSEMESPGSLVFTLMGTPYRLDALVSGDELYIIFADETTGVSTYPSGRYVYTSKPGANGTTILDFNKAINPPCAFTEFATCPLPPKQNILPLAIRAGEKNYH